MDVSYKWYVLIIYSEINRDKEIYIKKKSFCFNLQESFWRLKKTWKDAWVRFCVFVKNKMNPQ